MKNRVFNSILVIVFYIISVSIFTAFNVMGIEDTKDFNSSNENLILSINYTAPIQKELIIIYPYVVSEISIIQNYNFSLEENICFLNSTKNKVVTNTTNDDEHWAYDCAIMLLNVGIIEGYEDGSLKLEKYITREEAATVMSRAMKYYDGKNIKVVPDDYNTPYFDMILSGWSKQYIDFATYNEIFDGYKDKTFKKNKCISRQEVSKIVAKVFQPNNYDIDNFELDFLDKEKIEEWAYNYVEQLVYNNVIKGYPDNTFRPNSEITRAEFFTIICKELNLHSQH